MTEYYSLVLTEEELKIIMNALEFVISYSSSPTNDEYILMEELKKQKEDKENVR